MIYEGINGLPLLIFWIGKLYRLIFVAGILFLLKSATPSTPKSQSKQERIRFANRCVLLFKVCRTVHLTFRGYTSWRPKGANLDEAKRSRVAAVRCSARRLSIQFPKVHGCTFGIVLLTIQSALP